MKKLMIFTDGSVNPQSNIGYGAYLAIEDSKIAIELLKQHIKIKRFEDTSSTKLELQILLWALTDTNTSNKMIIIYTDSQNILTLQKRRKRLEQNDYRSKKNVQIKNHKLYREFYKITDLLNCEFFKVKGHKVSNQKTEIDILFTLVDRASRKAQRDENQ
jgi:ribonuclease HI